MPDPEECRSRIEGIWAIGRELQELARGTAAPLAYGDLESRLKTLHTRGSSPKIVWFQQRRKQFIAIAERAHF
jgi:hypothetical protein